MMIEGDGILIVHPGKCTISFVQIVEKKLKFRSNRMVLDPFIVGIVTKNIGLKDFRRRYIEKSN
jgi:hypothetical protein